MYHISPLSPEMLETMTRMCFRPIVEVYRKLCSCQACHVLYLYFISVYLCPDFDYAPVCMHLEAKRESSATLFMQAVPTTTLNLQGEDAPRIRNQR